MLQVTNADNPIVDNILGYSPGTVTGWVLLCTLRMPYLRAVCPCAQRDQRRRP